MNIRWISTLVLFVTFLATHGVCYGEDDQTCLPDAIVFFCNGVLNDEDKAEENNEILQDRLDTNVSGTDLEGKIGYGLAHNPSASEILGLLGLLDFFETFVQSAETKYSKFWRYLAGLDLMPDILQDKLKEIASWVDSTVVSLNPSVQEHIEKYDEYLRGGNTVVLVAHSQGNLYGNIAYLGLDQQHRDGFGIVSVANPDSYVAGGGPYTTIDEDKIILPLQFLSPFFALPPNLDNFSDFEELNDWSGHEFRKSYMASGHDAETVILDNVVSMIDNLNQAVRECGCVEDVENPSPMTARFTYLITSGGPDNAPFTVQFTDTSTGSPTAWLWDFGDGWTGTVQNPTHTYATNGPHIVTLKAYVSGSYTTVPPGAVTGRKKDGIAGWMDGAYTDFATREWTTVSPPTLGRIIWTYTIFFNPTVHAFMGEDAVYSYNLTGFPTADRIAELQIIFDSAYYPHGGVITNSGKRPVLTGSSWHTVEDVTSKLGTQFNVGWTDDTGFANYGSVGGYISAGTRVKVTESTMSSRCIQTIH